MAENGRGAAQPKRPQLGIRVDRAVRERFHRMHLETGMPLNSMFMKMLDLFDKDPDVAELRRAHGTWLELMQRSAPTPTQSGRRAGKR